MAISCLSVCFRGILAGELVALEVESVAVRLRETDLILRASELTLLKD